MYFDTGSVMRSLPSSIIIMIATPVTGFVIDAMRNTESFVIGFFESMSVTPVASKCAMRPWRATSVTPPLISPAAMWRFIISVMRPSRSLERPTSSGFADRRLGRRTQREHATRTTQPPQPTSNGVWRSCASPVSLQQALKCLTSTFFYGVPAGPLMCSTSCSFSWQMYSISSSPGRSRAVNLIVNGFV